MKRAKRMARQSAKGRHDPISIRPGVRVLSVLRHLNYKPWFALAEFVDNALQSYLANRTRLRRVEGKDFQLHVAIKIDSDDGGTITIRDNAAGIAEGDYARAFRAAEVPADVGGLSEFGMGMKSAACWFAPNWSVRTKALGERLEKTVSFDIRRILRDSLEELDVETRPSDEDKHFTEIVLRNLHHKAPHGRTLGKVRDHLAGIYRVFARQGDISLTINGDPLVYQIPAILRAPYHKTPAAKAQYWRKDISIKLGPGLKVDGFAALRETGSTAEAGFALFRRNRLIQGSADEGYRPEFIFGQSNSYAYQRLFGELHLQGFSVSHTKDGFQWGENEDAFLSKLKARIATAPVPLLDQAAGYRSSPSRQLKKKDAEAIADRTVSALQRSGGSAMARLAASGPADATPKTLPKKDLIARREFLLRHQGQTWEVILDMSNDPSVGTWVELAEKPHSSRRVGKQTVRQLHIRFSIEHPFTRAFIGAGQESLEPQLRIAAALALAEVVAREAGVRQAGTVLRNVNELLRDALSRT